MFTKPFEYDFMLKLRFYMMICEQNFELSMESYSERFRNVGAKSNHVADMRSASVTSFSTLWDSPGLAQCISDVIFNIMG